LASRRGKLKLNGGAGRLAGASGESSMVWCPSAHELSKQLDGTVLQNMSDIVILRDFKLGKTK
jgi:hypothetical protein